MSLKDNLRAKIEIDALLQKLLSTIQEPPGKWWVDKVLTQELLDRTDFEHKKVSYLHFYVRALEGESMEVLVFDNELPIYHTTLADVALRKSPYWQEMFSLRNIRKIMNDQDVIVSKGKASLRRLHANALNRLDLTYTPGDLAQLLDDAREGLKRKSISQTQESLNLFLDLLEFESLSLGVLGHDLHIFGGPMSGIGAVSTYIHLILFDDETLSLGLKKGPFSQEVDLDLAWVRQYAQGAARGDLEGIAVFEFLVELATEKVELKTSKPGNKSYAGREPKDKQ